jgi:hypothetical protein
MKLGIKTHLGDAFFQPICNFSGMDTVWDSLAF